MHMIVHGNGNSYSFVHSTQSNEVRGSNHMEKEGLARISFL